MKAGAALRDRGVGHCPALLETLTSMFSVRGLATEVELETQLLQMAD
jgi:hypothetical protein